MFYFFIIDSEHWLLIQHSFERIYYSLNLCSYESIPFGTQNSFHTEVHQFIDFQVCNLLQTSLLSGTSVIKTMFYCLLLSISQISTTLYWSQCLWPHLLTLFFFLSEAIYFCGTSPSSLLLEKMNVARWNLMLCHRQKPRGTLVVKM